MQYFKNLGQYHDWYVQSDTALLADVFENFRDKSLDIDKLDPAYFLSAPGLSWQSGLKMTGSYLMDVDANNLYGYAMSKKMPTDNFQWIEDLLIFTEDYIKNYDKNSDTGYLLVVDVTYPKDLYEKHEYLPFLPDKIKIDKVLSYLVISMIKSITLYIFVR